MEGSSGRASVVAGGEVGVNSRLPPVRERRTCGELLKMEAVRVRRREQLLGFLRIRYNNIAKLSLFSCRLKRQGTRIQFEYISCLCSQSTATKPIILGKV